jgi:hypothetical protein
MGYFCFIEGSFLCISKNSITMDKQTLWMIIVAALLLFVWLPALVISVRKTLRKNKMNHNNTK